VIRTPASTQLRDTDCFFEGGEVENPRERVPRAMTWSYGVGWLFLITFMFTFNFHIGDPEVIGTAPPGWVWSMDLRRQYLLKLTQY
jgi:hypothetical protein